MRRLPFLLCLLAASALGELATAIDPPPPGRYCVDTTGQLSTAGG